MIKRAFTVGRPPAELRGLRVKDGNHQSQRNRVRERGLLEVCTRARCPGGREIPTGHSSAHSRNTAT